MGSARFAKWFGNFGDTMSDLKANATMTEFVRNKIRERVNDPVVAEKLVPKDHPWGTKRVPLESGYYEAYNRDNVLLVDLNETPIERITPTGIKTSDTEYECDVIVYATASMRSPGRLIRSISRGGRPGRSRTSGADGPRTYLGLQSAGFPNLFTVVGPHNGATFCNIPRCIEQNVEVGDRLPALYARARLCPDRCDPRGRRRLDGSRR